MNKIVFYDQLQQWQKYQLQEGDIPVVNDVLTKAYIKGAEVKALSPRCFEQVYKLPYMPIMNKPVTDFERRVAEIMILKSPFLDTYLQIIRGTTLDRKYRKVIYKDYCPRTRKLSEYYNADGIFHQWGSEFVEFESGPGNTTVAIIEKRTGEIVTVYPHNIKFMLDE